MDKKKEINTKKLIEQIKYMTASELKDIEQLVYEIDTAEVFLAYTDRLLQLLTESNQA